MQNFAECLKKYLEENGISYSYAAKMTGIDRTLIGRYANGQRIPKNQKVVEDLVLGMGMTKDVYAELLSAYRRTLVCQKYHVDYKMVIELLKWESSKEETEAEGIVDEIGRTTLYREECAENLYSETEVREAISDIFNGASWIKIKAETTCQKLQKIIKESCLIENCQVEYIIGVERHKYLYAETKVKKMLQLQPLLFFNKKCQIYYYQTENGLSQYDVRENYILTDKGMVFFDKSLKNGFLSNQKQKCLYYSMIYDKMKARCRLLAESGTWQYDLWNAQQISMVANNSNIGVKVAKTQENNCIYLIKEEEKYAVCIREITLIQLLDQFMFKVGE